MPSDWMPCGGDPFGRWIEKSADTKGFALHIYAKSSTGATQVYTCDAQVTRSVDSFGFRFEIHDGGKAIYSQRFGPMSFDVLNSCVLEKVSQSCERLQLTGSCSPGVCGICSCTASNAVELEGTWTRSPTTLTFSTPGFTSVSLDYCVQGNEMTVRDSSGVLVTLARTAVSGAPTPCAQRTSDCTVGGGCRLGACIGGTTCATAATEAVCTTRQGCSWAPDQCGGTAPTACKLADYGIVPGCVLLPGTPECTGTYDPCEKLGVVDCSSTAGCQWMSTCVGGQADCEQSINGCSSSCDLIQGCRCDGATLKCVGTANCAQQTDDLRCRLARGCRWVDCHGPMISCSRLNELNCETSLGCRLQVTP
jgi:hypothetical protein